MARKSKPVLQGSFKVYSKRKGKLVPAKGRQLKRMKKTLQRSYNYRGRR